PARSVSGTPVPRAPASVPPPPGPPPSGPPVPVPSSLEEQAPPDAEHVLAEHQWRFDPDTLREVAAGDEVNELTKVRDALGAKLETVTGNGARARLLSLRAVVSRILGDLDKALADGKLALGHAEAPGELRRIAI